jgi:gliding-associated putative ABC transporter substrate-binding component GldG
MKSKLYTSALLLIGIVIVLNLLAEEFHLRLDLTEDRQYTLSSATKQIIDNLEEPVTIKAYFSKDLPPHIAKTRSDFQDLLIEYANRSDEQIIYEFVNPNEKESIEQEASQNGIRPVLINVREKDQVKQQKAFLGAVVHLGDKKEVIPFIQPGAAMEYALSTAIKKISVDNKPKVGFISGHGEASISEMTEANQQLSILYQTVDVPLNDSTNIPQDIKTLALIRPMDSIPSSHLEKLDKFLAGGGRLMIAINRVQGDFRSLYGMPVHTGLEKWLKEKGVEVADNFLIDAQCGSVSVPQQFGGFTLQANISFPYIPVVGTFANHPISSGLESVMFEFASELKLVPDSARKITALAFTSEKSAALPAPQFFDINKEWSEGDFTNQHIPVAAAIEGTLSGNQVSRMVVVSDGDFPVNGPPQQQRRVQPDNINLFVNTIDWLSDDTGLIELRTRGAVSRPIRELDEGLKTTLKYGNFLLPIILIIGYGLIRAQRKRIERLKLIEETF